MTVPALVADPGLSGLVQVVRDLYDAVLVRLVVLDAAGRPVTGLEVGVPEAVQGAGGELVAQVLAAGAVVTGRGTCGWSACGDCSWVGAPVRGDTGVLLGVLLVAAKSPARAAAGTGSPADVTGLTTMATALGARLELLPPMRVPVPSKPVPLHLVEGGPGPALVDRDVVLRAGDAALQRLHRTGEGAVAALVLQVHAAVPSPAGLREDVVHRLRGQLRPGDLLARLSDDAYVVLLPDLPSGARFVALGVADRLGASLAEAPGTPSGLRGASTGLAVCSTADAAVDGRLLVQRAERAAAVAGRRGPGHVHMHREQGAVDTRNDEHVEVLLRTALDELALVVHYQPIVALHARDIVGVEALVRLRATDGTLVPPDRFITIAERTGLIGALGEQVRRTAITTVAGWKRDLPAARPFGLGVNLSVLELSEPGLVDAVRSELADSGLPPDALNLEVTESTFMDEGRGHEEVLGDLRALGPKLFIDDFGTGSSSLSYLRRFPVDGLKIDRTFVGDLLSGPQPAAVTAAIVNLAHELGVHVVAEGVETEQQAEILTGLGCRLAQGYLFSRPQPAEVVESVLLPTSPAAVAVLAGRTR